VKLLESTLGHLRALVACDSTNPPRRPESVVERLTAALREGGLEVDLRDHGDGCVAILATRGRARVLMNAHVDTVPVAPGWKRDPFTLTVVGDRAYGLGACDVKGGAAAMLAAALATNAPCALLFTTDEEAGDATCMRRFVASERAGAPAPAYDLAIVAEPTGGAAVLAHRGVGTGILRFEGRAGHSSQKSARSALHALVEWGDSALELASELDAHGDEGLSGVRFNIGRVSGGEKPNVVAGRAEASFGVRPPPSMHPRDALKKLADLAIGASFEERFLGPPLPASAESGARAKAEASALGLATGAAVDFWTEASLLSAAGIPSLVLGPGDIAQAHGPDEWVSLADLDAAANAYLSVLERAARGARDARDGRELGDPR
jgi:acetylornithine deacetylase